MKKARSYDPLLHEARLSVSGSLLLLCHRFSVFEETPGAKTSVPARAANESSIDAPLYLACLIDTVGVELAHLRGISHFPNDQRHLILARNYHAAVL